MKLFSVLLWFCVFASQVLSDNNSVGYELLHFYYVYKMEYESQVQPKTVAVGCTSKYGRMCYFDEFARHLIEHEWLMHYRPDPDDHTVEPDKYSLRKLFVNTPASASYQLLKLRTTITAETAQPKVFEEMLTAANAAIQATGFDDDDWRAAVYNIQQVQAERSVKVVADQMVALQSKVGDGGMEYLETTATGFDWDATFDRIREAVTNGDITENTANGYREEFRSFTYAPKDGPEKTHFEIVRAVETTITQLSHNMPAVAGGDDSPEPWAPSPKCSSEFVVFGEE